MDDADAGFIMLADPQRGDRYYQEFARNVAEDQAKVLSVDEALCVQYGCFENVLLTQETSRLDPGVLEYKYYAPGVGFILAVIIKGGDERTELVSITPNSGCNRTRAPRAASGERLRPEDGEGERVRRLEVHDQIERRRLSTGVGGVHYSITSSARPSTAGGIVRPRALAVLRLITNSNFVDCSTGMSAGLAPLRMRSTKDAACRYIPGRLTP